MFDSRVCFNEQASLKALRRGTPDKLVVVSCQKGLRGEIITRGLRNIGFENMHALKGESVGLFSDLHPTSAHHLPQKPAK